MNTKNLQLQQSPTIVDEIIRNSALNDRTIHIFGTIEPEMALEVQHYINRLIKYDKEARLPDEDKKMTLIINSYGGVIWAGNIIVGAIQYAQSLGYKVKGICQGFAFSMAFDVLLACDEREGYSFSEYMVHQSSGGTQGEIVHMERSIEYTKAQWEKCVKFYMDKTNITKEQLDKIYETRKDWFMLCEEALELGVIHKILK